MNKILKSICDLITMPFISAAILIHESREVNKEEILARKYSRRGTRWTRKRNT